jgi:hypothetical protein
MSCAIVAMAAQASGPPPKVVPWSPFFTAAERSSRTKTTPAGTPPPAPFAPAMRSGRTPAPSPKNSVPVRPNPVCTSSKTSSAPLWSQSARIAAK